ncbi:ABC transporter permease [Eisenibacter elegans]|uniref:ABC transporter permease n=1 Tax=Eisenibacter elegans TaxID=997 RepID=UPI000406E727|nr:FtsX-like permease family protein [Eisenibacter elegans]
MNIALRIARRYFLSGKKTRFINIISMLSMLGVAIGTTALIIVLSVFNGLEDLIRNLHQTINPELKVSLQTGKSFEVSEEWLAAVRKIEGVALVVEAIEDNAVLKYRDGQMVVHVKGVSSNYPQSLPGLDSIMKAGRFELQQGQNATAVLGQTVAYTISLALHNEFDMLELWYPKRLKTINLGSLSAEANFNRVFVKPAGIFSLEQQYDASYVFVPLSVAETLLDYSGRRTALEIKTSPGVSISKVKRALQRFLGDDFLVQNSDEQQAGLLRALRIEKFFVYLTLSFILAVASFNIFFSLMMLAIEKKRDIAILYALGAEQRLVKRVFLWEGAMIAFSGALIGLSLGVLIVLLQQRYSFVGMGTTTTVVSAYPVVLQFSDICYTAITMAVITVAAAIFPAIKAGQVDVKEEL